VIITHSAWQRQKLLRTSSPTTNNACGDCHTCHLFSTDERCCGMTGLRISSS
jgi:hypothetical protein